MKVVINGELLEVNDNNYLSEGKEGISYQINKKVIKVLHKYPVKYYLREDDINRLKNISTFVLDHPIEIAKDDNDKYLGPVSNYIKSNGYYSFANITGKDFVEKINLIIKDGITYAKNRYLIADLQYDDTIFDENGNLHLVDSGSYSYKPNMNLEQLERINLDEIDNYFLNEVIENLLIQKGISKKKRESIKNKILNESKEYGSIALYLQEKLVNYSTVNDYIGKLRK